eukprot:1150139-Pelagomonas_calceolata.AAC.1
MIAERLEFQNSNSKQSQHDQPANQGKPLARHQAPYLQYLTSGVWGTHFMKFDWCPDSHKG